MGDVAVNTLWAKDLPLDQLIHRFTVGEDPIHDLKIYAHDCMASAAHVRMLGQVGLMAASDVKAVVAALQRFYQQAIAGVASIDPSLEDCHSAIEFALCTELGEVGKRVHAARSRNDQVLAALRLYLREQLLHLNHALLGTAQALLAFGQRQQGVMLPGYTHLRRAMPDQFDAWAAAYAEGLLEEVLASEGVWLRLDQSPLGAAAGFGVPMPIDRQYVAKLLGWSKVQRQPADCMHARGRHQQALLDMCVSVASTLEKLLWDLSIFSTEEFGFVVLPDAFTTGSSIMPNKRNPDVIELARGKCRELRGLVETHRQICNGLPGSYHRDYQLSKASLFASVDIIQQLLAITQYLLPQLQINAQRTAAACTDELFATQAAYQLVQQGMPFRDAYKKIAASLAKGDWLADRQADPALAASRTAAIEDLQRELQAQTMFWQQRQQQLTQHLQLVWELT